MRLRRLAQDTFRRIKKEQVRSDLALLLTSPYFIYKKLLREAIRCAVADLPGHGVLVDLGCGYRPYQAYFQGYMYVGVDDQWERHPTLYAQVDCLPLEGRAADGVLCTEVLEHTSEPGLVCAEMARITRAGGFALVTAPMSWNLHYEPRDYYRFTHYGLAHLLRKAGFEIVTHRRLGGLGSLTGARWADVGHRTILRLPGVRKSRVGFAAATILVAPFNLVAALVGGCLDKIDETDALGWLVVARRAS